MERLGKHNQRLKELRRRARERRDGEVVVDGRRLIADLVRWDVPIRELYVAAGIDLDRPVRAVSERVWEVEASVLTEVAPTRHPQGVLAVVDEPSWPPWSARSGVALWLEGVQDPGNLGAIVRAAAGLGARAVLLSPGCADPFGPLAVRGSAGAVFRIPVAREVPGLRAIERVRAHSGEAWATAAEGAAVTGWRPADPTLLLLGAEGRGLSAEVAALADGTVAIPLDRDLDSLNVAVAAGILLEQLRSTRKRRRRRKRRRVSPLATGCASSPGQLVTA
jgi:TrmH family RNA methyltransferase